MTNLDILRQDLATHEARLLELQDPDFGKARTKKGGLSAESNINPMLLIPSYTKIIASLKEEITQIKTKEKA